MILVNDADDFSIALNLEPSIILSYQDDSC